MNRFNPGQVVATPGALAALEASGESLFDYLTRHLSGDWGDIDAHDRRENQLSLEQGFRLMSVAIRKSELVLLLLKGEINLIDKYSTSMQHPGTAVGGPAT